MKGNENSQTTEEEEQQQSFYTTSLDTLESIACHDFSLLIPCLMDGILNVIQVISKEVEEEEKEDVKNINLKINSKKRKEKERITKHQKDVNVLNLLIQTLKLLCKRGNTTDQFNAISSVMNYQAMHDLLRIGCLQMKRNEIRTQLVFAILNICQIGEQIQTQIQNVKTNNDTNDTNDNNQNRNIWNHFIRVLVTVGMVSNDQQDILVLKCQDKSKEYLNLLSRLIRGSTTFSLSSSTTTTTTTTTSSASIDTMLLINIVDTTSSVLMMEKKTSLNDHLLKGLLQILLQSIQCLNTSDTNEIEKNNHIFTKLLKYIIHTCLFPTTTTLKGKEGKESKESKERNESSTTTTTPICGHDSNLRKGAYSILLEIVKSSPSSLNILTSSLLLNQHSLGDFDIINKKKKKKKKKKTNGTLIGNLFDSDNSSGSDDALTTTTTYTRSNKWNKWNSWASVKSETGFVGLDNLACICYMNSSLQNLYMVPEFRQAILSVSSEVTQKINSGSVHYSNHMFYQLQRLMSVQKKSGKAGSNVVFVRNSFDPFIPLSVFNF